MTDKIREAAEEIFKSVEDWSYAQRFCVNCDRIQIESRGRCSVCTSKINSQITRIIGIIEKLPIKSDAEIANEKEISYLMGGGKIVTGSDVGGGE